MAILKCECGYHREVPDKYLGKKVKCPKCQNSVNVTGKDKKESEITKKSVEIGNDESNNLTIKCPHCQKSFVIEESTLLKNSTVEKMIQKFSNNKSEIVKKAKEKIGNIDTDKAKENLSKAFDEGKKNYLYVLPALLLISIIILVIVSKIDFIIYLLISWSMLFIYYDTTQNKIGKIEEEKGLLNNSPGVWTIGTMLLWIVVFPIYLLNRKKLIQNAKENPKEPVKIRRKMVLSILSIFYLLILISGFTAGNGNNFVGIASGNQPPESFLDSNLRTVIKGIVDDTPGTSPLDMTLRQFLKGLSPVPSKTWEKGNSSNEWILRLGLYDKATGVNSETILVFLKPEEKVFKGDVVLTRHLENGLEASRGQVAGLAMQIAASAMQKQ